MNNPPRTFFAANQAAGVVVILQHSIRRPHNRELLVICQYDGQQRVYQVEDAEFLNLIDSHPVETCWRVKTLDIAPALHEALNDHLVITLHPGDGPPLAAFSRCHITRNVAAALLMELPGLTAVGYSEDRHFRQRADRAASTPAPQPEPSTQTRP